MADMAGLVVLAEYNFACLSVTESVSLTEEDNWS